MLLVTIIIVFTIRPEINMKRSAIIILAVFCAAMTSALPGTMDAEVREYYESNMCISDSTESKAIRIISDSNHAIYSIDGIPCSENISAIPKT